MRGMSVRRTLRGVTVHWVAFLRVNDESAARKLLTRIETRLAVPLDAGEIERYWKDASLYRCTFTTALHAENPATALHAVLGMAARLAPSWHVNSLPPSDNLAGWTNEPGIAVAGVTSVGFDLGQ